MLQSLRFLFSLGGPRPAKGVPPVKATSASKNEGIAEAIEEIEKLAAKLVESGKHRDMRRARLEEQIRKAIQQHLWTAYSGQAGAGPEIQRDLGLLGLNRLDELTPECLLELSGPWFSGSSTSISTKM